MAGPVYFASEPHAIDRHAWRVIVTDSRFGGRRFAYQFAALGELPIWQDMQQWPAFAMNTPGMGLPMALALIYEANAVAIADAMLDRAEVARLMMA